MPLQIVGVIFPVMIMALVPVRQYIMPRFFSRHTLQELDPAEYEEPLPKSQDKADQDAVESAELVRNCVFVLLAWLCEHTKSCLGAILQPKEASCSKCYAHNLRSPAQAIMQSLRNGIRHCRPVRCNSWSPAVC